MTKTLRCALAAFGAFGLLCIAFPNAPRSHARSSSNLPTTKTTIPWRSSLLAAQQESKRSGKPILVYFHATWCGPCHALERTTWRKARVVRAARLFVPVKVDADRNPVLAQRYNAQFFPTMLFIAPSGRVAHTHIGYLNTRQALKTFKLARRKVRAQN